MHKLGMRQYPRVWYKRHYRKKLFNIGSVIIVFPTITKIWKTTTNSFEEKNAVDNRCKNNTVQNEAIVFIVKHVSKHIFGATFAMHNNVHFRCNWNPLIETRVSDSAQNHQIAIFCNDNFIDSMKKKMRMWTRKKWGKKKTPTKLLAFNAFKLSKETWIIEITHEIFGWFLL